MKTDQSKTGHNRNPDKTPQNSKKLSRDETVWKCPPLNYNRNTRYFTAASPVRRRPHVQRLEDSLAVPLNLFLRLSDELCDSFEISYLIASAVRHSAGQRMSGSSCLFRTPSEEYQAVVQSCL